VDSWFLRTCHRFLTITQHVIGETIIGLGVLNKVSDFLFE